MQLIYTHRSIKENNRLKKDNNVLAVVYGKGFENINIAVDKKEATELFHQVGYSQIIDLKDKDSDTGYSVLIHDIDFDPVHSHIRHIDFLKVNMNQTIRTEVALHFIGESRAVFNLGGTMVTVLEDIEVECLPKDLPAAIEVDISKLDEFSDTIHVSDLVTDPKVTILTDPESLIVKVEAPKTNEELEAELSSEVGQAVNEEDLVEANAQAEEAKKQAAAKTKNT